MGSTTISSTFLVILLSLTCAHAEESSDPFSRDNYEATFAELAKCSLPTAKLFMRAHDPSSGKTFPDSPFDQFCGIDKPYQRFMCQYYQTLYHSYYHEFCQQKQEQFGRSSQWTIFQNDPNQPCQYLVENLQTQNPATQQLISVFGSVPKCQEVCPAGDEFCLGFAFLLRVYNLENNLTRGEDTNQVAKETNDEVQSAENTDAVHTNEEESHQSTDHGADGSKETLNTNPLTAKDGHSGGLSIDAEKVGSGDPHDENLTIPGTQNGEDQLPVSDDEVNKTAGENGDSAPFVPGTGGDQSAEGKEEGEHKEDGGKEGDGLDVYQGHQEQHDEDTVPGDESIDPADEDSYSDSSESVLTDDDQLPLPVEPGNTVPENSGGPVQYPAAVQAPVKSGAESPFVNRNLETEREIRLLEEESSSHFLPYTLCAIILIMVTYILYHNKQKIVAIIVEGKNPGGRRRRYNQNV